MAWYSARDAQPEFNSVSTPKRIRVQIEISSDESSDERSSMKRQKTLPFNRNRIGGGSSSAPAVLSDSDSDSSLELAMPPKQKNRKSPTARITMRVDDALLDIDYSQFKNKQPALIPTSPAHNWSKSQIQASKAESDRTRHIHMEACPFYDIDNFGIRMYCGKGFKDFHIAVGTLEGLEELCSDWTRKTLAMRHDLEPLPEMSHERKHTLAQDQFVGKAIEILPDIEPDYLREMFNQYVEKYHPGKVLDGDDHALIMDEIMLKPGYPKIVKQKRKQITFEPANDGTGVTIPLRQDMRERPSYHKQGVIILAWEFLHIPTITIDQVFRRMNTIYDTYIELVRLDTRYFEIGVNDGIIRRKKEPRTTIEKKYQLQGRSDQAALPFWLNEVQAAKQSIKRKEIKDKREARWKEDEEINAEYHRKQNALTTCFICYGDDIPLNRAVPCQGEKVHFFCYECVQTLADTQIGILKHEMHCHDPGDASGQCTAPLDRTLLQEALDKKIIAKLDSIQQATEIRNAEIEGLEQCPFCDYKQIFDADDLAVVFQCMDPKCARASCRKCRADAHIPKTCEEVSNERGLSARHRVEEARSESIMRTCPKCKVRIIKEHGCNKMLCVQCHTLMCYICQIDITAIGYDHFHKPGSKCVLYDQNTNEMHEHEADAAEQAEIAEVRADNPDINEEELRIETGKEKDALAPTNVPQRAPGANLGFQPFVPQFMFGQPVARQVRPPQLRPVQPVRQRMQHNANMDGAFDVPAFPGRPAGPANHPGVVPLRATRDQFMAQHVAPNQNVPGFVAVPAGPPGGRYPALPYFDQQLQGAQQQGYFTRIQQLLGRRL